MFSALRNVALVLAFTGGSLFAQSLTQISPVIYENPLMKSFLSQYLALTEAQMVQMDLAFAQARAQLFPLSEKLKQIQTKLNASLTNGDAADKWKLIAAQYSEMQGKVFEVECATLVKFQSLLDGDQRHKLAKLSNVEVITNEQGKPVVAYALAMDVQ